MHLGMCLGIGGCIWEVDLALNTLERCPLCLPIPWPCDSPLLTLCSPLTWAFFVAFQEVFFDVSPFGFKYCSLLTSGQPRSVLIPIGLVLFGG